MYAFICPNGHVSYSEAKDPLGGCGDAACDEGAYRIVTGEEAQKAGVHTHDCTRTVKHPNGASLELHMRTGMAYSYRALSLAVGVVRRGHLRSCG